MLPGTSLQGEGLVREDASRLFFGVDQASVRAKMCEYVEKQERETKLNKVVEKKR